MGASASITVSGVASLTDTGSGWWFQTAAAVAATYAYDWNLKADTTSTSVGPAPAVVKFAAGPAGVVWPGGFNSVTGGLGSVASATQSGSSTVNVGKIFNTYSVATTVTATAAAAAAPANAKATAAVIDPWNYAIPHVAGRQTYLMVSVTPDIVLTPPGKGASGCLLSGGFGEVGLSLDGATNAPACRVQLAPDWQVYANLRFPAHGFRLPAPRNPLTPAKLEQLFLRRHDPAAPLWTWRRAAPTLTFIRPAPPSLSQLTLEVRLAVEDADAGEGEGRRSKG